MSRTLANLGLKGGYADGADDWGEEQNANLLKLSVLVQAGVKGRVAAIPNAPAEGDIYVLTAAPNEDAVAVYDNATWSYFVPAKGWLLYDRDAEVYISYDGAAWAELATGGGGGGSAEYPDFDGNAGKVLTVNEDEDGVEWAEGGGGGGSPVKVSTAGRDMWRMRVSDTESRTFVSVAEIEMRDAPGGPDLCVGGTPFGSYPIAGLNYAKAFDNDLAGDQRWAAETSNAWTEKWVGYRFAGPVNVVQIAITAAQNYGVEGPRTFALEFYDKTRARWIPAVVVVDMAPWANGEQRLFNIPPTVNLEGNGVASSSDSVDVPYENGWVDFDANADKRIVKTGRVVTIYMYVKAGNYAAQVLTLPVGWRPEKVVRAPMFEAGQLGWAEVRPNGQVHAIFVNGDPTQSAIINMSFVVPQADAYNSGGSGGSNLRDYTNSIDRPPEDPSALNDEFEGNVLNPAWEWVNKDKDGISGTAVVKNGSLRMSLTAPQGGQGNRLLVKDRPITTDSFAIIAKVRISSGYPASYHTAGLALYNPSTGVHHVTKLQYRGQADPNVGWIKWNNPNQSGDENNRNVTKDSYYLAISSDGINIRFGSSPDGIDWQYWNGFPVADLNAFTKMALVYGCENATFKGTSLFEWVRYFEGGLPPEPDF